MAATREPYPATHAERDRYVLARRPPRPRPDPWSPHGVVLEQERMANGAIARAAVVFLTGRECPWRCAMCDLWMQTTAEDTPLGAIPRQLDAALETIARGSAGGAAPAVIKLYNAGSFFDPRAIPVGDYRGVAARLRRFTHVTVESHPALVGERVDLLLDELAAARDPEAAAVALEVAMGLETAHPESLARLHKGMTLEQFGRAADWLKARGVRLRAFLLVPPPFVAREEEAPWLRRSVDYAFEAGACVVSLIPTRTGNGALDALKDEGLFRPPRLADLEQALAASLPEPRGRVFADLWDLGRFADCDACLPARRERLQLMNFRQVPGVSVPCELCGHGVAS